MTPHEIAPEPADPFLWLEEVADPRALEWAADQTDRTNETFAGTTRSALEERLTRILDDPDRLVVPGRHGDLMYDLWRDADNPRGLWRRTSRAAFAAGSPEWQVLLDIDALGRAEGRAWSFAGATHAPAGSDRALVRLSPDGGDAAVVREYDLAAARFVDDSPFSLDAHKHRVAWIDSDTLLVATALHGGGVTDSGYPITARVWHRGTALDDAPPILSGAASDVGVFVHVDHPDGHATPLIVVAHDFFSSETWAWRDGESHLIEEVPTRRHLTVTRDDAG